MKIIGTEELDELSRQAKHAERLRKNLNLHDSYDDPCQRLFNALEPGSYIRPHRHTFPPKPETFVVVRGEMKLLTFSDAGDIDRVVHLKAGADSIAIDLPPGVWHMVVARQPGTIFFETKPGPYQPLSDKDFAPWAPAEGSEDASRFLRALQARLDAGAAGA